MHDVSVLHDIVFSFGGQFTGSAAGSFASKLDEIGVFDHFGTNETTLKIGVNDSGTLRCFGSGFERPCAYFVTTCGEEGTEVEQGISGFDETVDTGLLQTDLFEEHLSLLVGLQFSDLALDLSGEHEHLGVLVFDRFAYLFDVGVARYGCGFIDVAHVHDRFVGEQEQVPCCGFLIFVIQFNGTGVLTL